ncbi:hypothetical protein FGO68_gene139 [Halteria grandinella]|uniref:Uncharacterized protein n=1 Tax=Halteria grandinella TaxID=5974 RepID=A0A8J8SZH7_HALGN|nr:hypothetical protein FGO68_gene139 [Halteria grandinella]
MSVGGVTTIQSGEGEKFWRFLSIAENGILGALTLRSSMLIFTVLDIFIGALYTMFLYQEVIVEWDYFNANGPHYLLTSLYYIRVLVLPIGILGFYGVSRQSLPLTRIYFLCILGQFAVLPLLGLLSSYDMCQSWIYHEPCKQIFTQNAVFSLLRALYLFYSAYITHSYRCRVERGELILVHHGKGIVELINTLQNQQKKGNDIELVQTNRPLQQTPAQPVVEQPQ